MRKEDKTPFLVLPTRISIIPLPIDGINECDECLKQNEELGVSVYDCTEECEEKDNDTDYTISLVRMSLDSIEEYFPVNEEETWIKAKGRFGKYIVNSDILDEKLSKYIHFIK